MVVRGRLEPLRAAAESSRLVLVSAPAGYGKSTLVAQWMDADSRAGCWVQLGRGDNDPVVLLARVVAALESTGAVDGGILEALSMLPPRIDEVALPLLAADLVARDPIVLVLDDVHAVRAEGARAVLQFLVERVPPGSQLVLVARGDPPVSLGRLRAEGDLVEVGPEALALDGRETRDIASGGGLDLSETAAEGLRVSTEGWVAAVVLATLSLKGREDAEARAAGLSGDQAQIADYLLEEVLERQPEHLKEFLLATSILGRIRADLCDAVLGTTSGAASLDALARSNAFVITIDDRREWFRYHHLFGDLLRAELRRRHPELVPVYFGRAATWSEAHGSPGEAFHYAHAAGELAQAGRIALAHREELSRRGQSESVRLWLDECTDAEIASDPQLSITAAWVYLFCGDVARSKRYIAAAGQHALDVPSADGASSLRSALANVRSAVASDGITQMLSDGELVYASEETGMWRASGCRAMGIAYVLLGRPQDAIPVLRECLALLADTPELAHFRAVALGYLSLAAADDGDWSAAHRWVVQSTQLVSDKHLEETVGGAIAATAQALANLQRGDHVQAMQQLQRAQDRRRYLPQVHWLEADLALRCAEVSLGFGDAHTALEAKRIAGDALQGYPNAGALPDRLEHLKARIHQGEAYGLTAAELRILRYLPTHLSLQEIADQQYLARSTVKTHVARIYDKLAVPGRTEAVELIQRLGLARHPDNETSSQTTTEG